MKADAHFKMDEHPPLKTTDQYPSKLDYFLIVNDGWRSEERRVGKEC